MGGEEGPDEESGMKTPTSSDAITVSPSLGFVSVGGGASAHRRGRLSHRQENLGRIRSATITPPGKRAYQVASRRNTGRNSAWRRWRGPRRSAYAEKLSPASRRTANATARADCTIRGGIVPGTICCKNCALCSHPALSRRAHNLVRVWRG